MKAILDTHAFLWALAGDARMSVHAREIFTGSAELFLSIASVWEILIKVQSGKLPFPRPAGPYVLKKMAENRIDALPITLDHLLAIERLPMHHRDPFDRTLIAQSMEEGWPIITADPKFKQYPIRVIW
ncbi:MAG TPA: type II toxin-antitoxin system VapC family toxin [Candidatus Dormibacteraeota bacterium]|nr:type II toxin-antitoxin system VapC family toxin [Candidatus Dormibacteraeota bacterium]